MVVEAAMLTMLIVQSLLLINPVKGWSTPPIILKDTNDGTGDQLNHMSYQTEFNQLSSFGQCVDVYNDFVAGISNVQVDPSKEIYYISLGTGMDSFARYTYDILATKSPELFSDIEKCGLMEKMASNNHKALRQVTPSNTILSIMGLEFLKENQ